MSSDMSSMSGMDSSSSSSTSSAMATMETTFHTGISTPLYTNAFTPQNAGQYVGALIFLIILGIIFRFLAAAKVQMEHRWHEEQAFRKVVISRSGGDGDLNDKKSTGDVDEKSMGTATVITAASATSSSGASTSSETAVNGGVGESGSGTGLKTTRKERRKASVAPWRWKVDMVRGFMQLCIALVGYLLMLAVMTYNVGYLIGALAGIFLGEVVFGRYIHSGDH